MNRKRVLTIVGGAIAVVLAVFIYLAILARQEIVLYHPDSALPTPEEAGVPDIQPVTIKTADGLPLVSWFQKPSDDSKPILLFFMGDTGVMADRIGDFAPYIAQGYGILLLGYRGFGGNPGTPSEKGLYKDARAAVGWLTKEGYALSRVVFYGHSLGTGIAVEMAVNYPGAKAVVLEAPYTTLPNTVVLNMPLMQAGWFMKDRYDNLAKIAKIKIPLLIIQGTSDEVIPVAQGKALYAAAKGPKVAHFVPGAGHSDLYQYGEADMVMDFLAHPPPPVAVEPVKAVKPQK
jgi:fermentation-respiration switch protein FrsA (DUF1100 family)